MPKQIIQKEREAFSLVEVIIVMVIFSIVSVVALTTFLTSFKMGQRTTIENAIIEDSRFIMNSIVREIKNGSIDYEEYFNQCVMSATCPNQQLTKADFGSLDPVKMQAFGANYGYYDWQFKFGGYQDNTTTSDTDGFGGVCQNETFDFIDHPSEDCVTGPLTFSDDIDTGQNPNANWNGKSMTDSNALCSAGVGTDGYQTFKDNEHKITRKESFSKCVGDFYGSLASYTVNELYLINAEGNKKTILITEKIDNNNNALSKIEMIKVDTAEIDSDNADKAFPAFHFECAEGYACTGINNIPERIDRYTGGILFEDFVPISPLKVSVKNLQFIIFPVEDPRRAFAEINSSFGDDVPAIQVQPQVTILLELEPSTQYKLPFISDKFRITLQTTVSAGVTSKIPIISEE